MSATKHQRFAASTEQMLLRLFPAAIVAVLFFAVKPMPALADSPATPTAISGNPAAPVQGNPGTTPGPAAASGGALTTVKPIKVPPSAVATAPPSAAIFDFNEVQVQGNSKLSEREIDDAVYPFLGPGRNVADVENARAALEKAFADKGYVSVSVLLPRQDGRDGTVFMRVIERPIGRLRVVGAQYVAPSVIRENAPSLAPGIVPRLPDLQRDILALNQIPDRIITPALKEGAAPDTIDVDLKVEDHLPLHASLELNNRQSQNTTPLRLSGTLSYTNLWQRGDAATIGFQVAPQNTGDSSVYTASYLFRVPDSSVSLLATYLKSNSNVSTFGSVSVIGKGDIAGVRALVPLGNTDNFTNSASVGFDYKNLSQNTGIAGQFTNAPVAYYPVTLSYQAGWVSGSASTDAVASVIYGFRGIGSNALSFDNQRFAAERNFFAVKADVSRTQSLPYNTEGYARVTAQVSPDALLSSEQYGVGGLDTVRGYFESESLGDQGGSAQLELRSPPLARYVGTPINSLQAHVFADIGAVELRTGAPGQRPLSANLASIGAGLRFKVYDHLNGEVQDAIPLRDGPATHAGDNRVLFRLYGDF